MTKRPPRRWEPFDGCTSAINSHVTRTWPIEVMDLFLARGHLRFCPVGLWTPEREERELPSRGPTVKERKFTMRARYCR